MHSRCAGHDFLRCVGGEGELGREGALAVRECKEKASFVLDAAAARFRPIVAESGRLATAQSHTHE